MDKMKSAQIEIYSFYWYYHRSIRYSISERGFFFFFFEIIGDTTKVWSAGCEDEVTGRRLMNNAERCFREDESLESD